MKAKGQRNNQKLITAKQIDPSLDSLMVNQQVVIEAGDYIKKNKFTKIASFNTEHSSYLLKHLVEAHIGRYVSNESLIVAMVNCGFKGRPIVMGSDVYCFNLSRKSVNQASKGIIIF